MQSSNKYSNYIDLFYRGRFIIKPIDIANIHAVFDVYTVFGVSDEADDFEFIGGGLGRPGTNLVTRNLYGELRPTDHIEISFGLLPFSLSDGYILAENGTGIKYEHRIYKNFLNLYLFWIKAVEHSLADFNEDGLSDSGKFDDNIYVIGNKMLIKKITLLDIYYIFRNDQNDQDAEKGKKHWLAIHTNSNYKDFIIKTSAIYNFGRLWDDSKNVMSNIHAGLWATYMGYNFSYGEIGLRHEGATGNNIFNEQNGSSFQTIAHSRGLSYIFVDDSGGISLRSEGKLFATHINSLEIIFRYFTDIDINLKYFHHRSLYSISRTSTENSTHLGDEVNFYFKYRYLTGIFFEFTAASFWPNQAYNNWVNAQNREPLIEILLKFQINY